MTSQTAPVVRRIPCKVGSWGGRHRPSSPKGPAKNRTTICLDEYQPLRWAARVKGIGRLDMTA